jgi:hypothetical protein
MDDKSLLWDVGPLEIRSLRCKFKSMSFKCYDTILDVFVGIQ